MSQRVKFPKPESFVDELFQRAEPLRPVHDFQSTIRHLPEEDERNRQAHKQGLDESRLAAILPGELPLIGRNNVLAVANLLREQLNGILSQEEIDSFGLLNDLCFGEFDLLCSRTFTSLDLS